MNKPCQRPACEGTYEDMGGGELYCDTCGLAPVVAPGGVLGSTPTGMTSAGRDSRSSGSARSGSSSRASSRSSSRSQSSRRSVSGRLSRSLSGKGSARSVSVRSGRSGAASSARGRLGAGLVQIPDVPRPDPATVVLENPEVPERKRFCSSSDCGAPVGRSRGERPGRTEGFCTKCGHPYSFVPKLRPGDIVHGQYEVSGCLAHGGLGWVYLAVDRAVSDRWVVLKGLLDTGDEDAMAAAIAERRFLAEIEHANIVRIYNFVEHLDQRTGSLDGYIVMEYVGGKSLKEIANERRTPDGKRDPLPVEQACAYGIEALEALGHLHTRNLLYCDFKVDNAIQQSDQLKLIDLGAVRRMDDEDSAIYGTVGYQAPEVAEEGASVASDLYTVARTLAILTFDFQGYTNVFADSLPEPENIDVFQKYESFYRFLVRATDPDPQRRFASAEEMADQLLGVLREVVALQTGKPRPALSTLFGPELRVVDTELVARHTGDASLLGARTTDGRRRSTRAPALTPGSAPAVRAAVLAQVHGGVPAPAPGPGQLAAGAPVPAPGPASAAGSALVSGSAPAPASVPLPAQVGTGAGPGTGPGPAMPGTAPGAPAPPAPPGVPAGTNGQAAQGTQAAHGVSLVPLKSRQTAMALPVPRVDPADPNAGFLAGLMAAAPAELIAALENAPTDSIERRLRELRAHLETGEPSGGGGGTSVRAADEALDALEARHADDWRVVWYRGLSALATGDKETAALSFDAVYDAFPGEPAPKLALGICAEVLGQLDNAAEYYRLVWTTDPSYVSAAFGLARVRLAAGDRPGAVAALESVPEASIHYTAARVAAVRARLRQRSPHDPLLDDLQAAARQVQELQHVGLDAVRREELITEVLGCALDWMLCQAAPGQGAAPGTTVRGAAPPGGVVGGPQSARHGSGVRLFDSPLTEEGLRFGLERSYRLLARLAQSGTERIELVERANRFRPRTWV
ncbi:serine/threonine-protein kinase [Streptomyces iconiensis]|uniref:non-specific serine/threonine protein kinase n=1 Tax=Streptomyces iconiensis TaxID=1384038 RepID=A0ABT7A5K7_9ACTN|nr:serine/threonine-protein kinase [Streptomyces iconiensis]MDJ1136605.1 tetratricopeptide repeat protein [Streptomyces iconiensis]